MKKITIALTPAQAGALVWCLALGLRVSSSRRFKKSLALVSLRIADEIERVFPGETG